MKSIYATSRFAETPFLAADRMPAQRGEVPSLDGLRAFSILLVLLGHFVDPRFPAGLGVMVFFVISGFLITRLLLAEIKSCGELRLGAFYARRLLRLYPVIVIYTVLVLIFAAFNRLEYRIIEPLSALFYFANYYYASLSLSGADATLPFSIFWSLSVEEHFYFMFPAALVAIGANPHRLVLAMLVVMSTCLILRLAVAALHPDYLASHYFYFRSEFRMDSLAAGVIMAALCETVAGRRLLVGSTQPYAVCGNLAVVGVCLAVRDPWFRETVRYSLLGLALPGLIAAIVFSDRYHLANRILNAPLACAIGVLSYSFYVWHLGVATFIGANAWPFAPRIAMEFAGTAVVGLISYLCVERPFLSLRKRFGSQAVK